MDKVLEASTLEIALEGFRGCSFEKLVKLLQEYHEYDIKEDEDMQICLWSYLLRNSKLSFFKIVPNNGDSSTTNNTPPPKQKSNKKAPQKNDYQYTTEGFQEYAETRNNFDSRFSSKRLLVDNLSELGTLPTSDICIVAQFEYRKFALGLDIRSDVEISEIQYCMLEEVGRSRYSGRFQNDLTKYLCIDSRSTLYHLKRLYGLNLLLKKSSYDPRSKTTSNLIHLFRFTDTKKQKEFIKKTDDEVNAEKIFERYSQLKENIVDTVVGMLTKAKGNVLIDYEVRKKLLDFVKDDTQQKHKWERLKLILQASGKVEYFKAIFENRLTYCVRLLNQDNNLSSSNPIATNNAIEDGLLNPGFDMERPQLYQMYDYIEKFGGKSGLNHMDIYQHFEMTSKVSGNLCNDLRKDFGVTSVAEKGEKQAKSTSYRFFVPYIKEVENDKANEVSNNEQESPQKSKSRKKKKSQPPKQSTNNSQEQVQQEVQSVLPSINLEDSSDSLYDSDTGSDDESDENKPALTPSQYLRTEGKRKEEGSRKEVITKNFSERCKLALSFLKEKKCIARFQLREHFKQNNVSVESKAISRLIQYLESNNLAKKMTIAVPSLFGTTSKMHICLIDCSLDMKSKTVQDFITSLYSHEVQVNSKEKVDRTILEKVDSIDHLETKRSQKRFSYLPLFHSLLNGYINAKMLRVRVFHQYLWNKVNEGSVNPERICLYDIYSNMSVSLFCKLVGCIAEIRLGSDDKEILQTVTISNAPENIKKAVDASVVGRRAVALSRVETFIDIMEKLGLLVVQAIRDKESKSKVFSLLKTVEFPFPQQFPATEYRQVTFNSINDVEEYWDDLEMCSVNMETIRCEPIGDDQEDSPQIFSKIQDLGKRPSWTEYRHFSLRQLRILEASYKENQTPNFEECDNICKKLRIPMEQVVLYFYRYRNSILSKRISDIGTIPEGQSKSNTKRKKDDDFIVGDDEIEYESNDENVEVRAKKTKRLPSVSLLLIGNRKTRKGSTRKGNKKQPTDTNENTEKQKEKTIPTRGYKWTNEQDLLLLEGLSRLRELDPSTGTFLTKPIKWQEIADSIGDGITANRCKLRWNNVLRKLPWCKRALELAIGHRDLNKNNPNIPPIEIRTLVQTCRDQYRIGPSDSNNQLMSVDLPRDLINIVKYFKVIRFEPLVEDNADENINITTENRLRLSSLETLFKIILLTPDEHYDVKLANKLVKRFKSKEIEECFNSLRKRSIISKSKRGLRMKGYHLNINFTTKTTVNFYPPEIFEDAPKFRKRALMINEEDDSDEEDDMEVKPLFNRHGACFNPQSSGGVVAALMSMVMLEEIRLIPRVAPLSEEEKNQVGRTRSIQDMEEDDGTGVSNHLLRVGAVRPGENDHIHAEGTNIKSSHGSLQLPDWTIAIESITEVNLFSEMGAENEHQTHISRIVSEYGHKLSSIEFSIELPDQENENKRERDEFNQDNTYDPPQKKKKQHHITNSEIEAYFEMYAAESSSITTFTNDQIDFVENITYPEIKPLAQYIIESGVEEYSFWIERIILVYSFIGNTKFEGANFDTISQKFSDFSTDYDLSIKEILQQLVNFNCIVEVNSENETRFLRFEEAKLHTIPYSENGATQYRPISVFRQLSGELNDNLLQNFKKCIISRIMRYPGILEKKLINSIGVISAQDIRKVLGFLEDDQIIQSSYHRATSNEKLKCKNILFMHQDEMDDLENSDCYPTEFHRSLFVTPKYIFFSTQ
ncbi:predicted protein [Naegleria gruberi]|uniref:Predicted protein n=1 Tax=Naegleria gruberi TaxID=5762 RepID=D2UXU1_NAEGR|nr:uncharacterized protein NAEGRDRAFT_61241 [Naegleria gruberi]EFC50347.1 predicted protein [Naegleria gruberi]|eukprot:XP_002683091.1 predicted protein [Naegleria gruberi strain NEG-M]